MLTSSLLLLLQLAASAWAHPAGHEEHVPQPLERRNLDHCDAAFNEPEFVARTVESHGREYARLRRALGLEAPEPADLAAAVLKKAKAKRAAALDKRNYISVSKIDHKSNKTVTAATDPVSLFSDAGACILMPSVDQGPLYVKGEQVRKDITEGEAGIKLTLVVQVVDYKTCKAVPDAYVDIWSSNSTGVYVGVQGYPGMGDPKDASILKGTALRGIQLTDDHGVVSFDSVVPGHYAGRATHIHTIVYLGATKQPNNTITGGKAAHVGQLYFDQPLLTQVNKVQPYETNTMAILANTADFLFQQGANGDDPIVRYALVGDKLEDGMVAWIRYGINTANNLAVSPAAFMTPSGGVMNPDGPVAKMNQGGGFFGGFGGFGGGGFGGGWGFGGANTGKTAKTTKTKRFRALRNAIGM
ncbi:hypothetical protein HMPREF1624_08263 [Sporothrix schenckii ATCC 58251]|uniref:Intradiol ring-cleavage dioxygenases domain-containing protein n=1 Tax=Sporothrix schenckii (strain ATCC 58251 / de Perez 2211183) TaxID=1391915 RepID=U7PLM1_SPOS1|nr:hypothetical protein HMPREF1624_08263 [Sporothrix schenckii ATCC 58251]